MKFTTHALEVYGAVPEIRRDPDYGRGSDRVFLHVVRVLAQHDGDLRVKRLEGVHQVRACEEKILVLGVVHVRFFHHVFAVGDGEAEYRIFPNVPLWLLLRLSLFQPFDV